MNWQAMNKSPIRDGVHRVSASVNNPIIDTLISNIEYLRERVEGLEAGQGAMILYGAPVDPTRTYEVGTPVYLGDGSTEKVFLPAEAATEDSSDEQNWVYSPRAMAVGIVRQLYFDGSGSPLRADLALGGYVELDLIQLLNGANVLIPYGAATESNTELVDLFDDDCFINAGGTIEYTYDRLTEGVLYLSTNTGKLSRTSPYPRLMAVLTKEIRLVATTQHKVLRLYVCPEGFSGARFHTHSFYQIANGLGRTSGAYGNAPTFPAGWESTGRFIEHPSQVIPGVPAYPLSELITATEYTPTDDPEDLCDNSAAAGAGYLYNLFEQWPQVGTAVVPGWLSVLDPFFDEVDKPPGAVWGYTVKLIDRFASSNPERQWDPPVAPAYMLLTINGQPASAMDYVIDENGIWWLSVDYQNAPIATHNGEVREMRLWYVDAGTKGSGSTLKSIRSLSTFVDLTTPDSPELIQASDIMVQAMNPVLPFNPEDDVLRATIGELEVAASALGDHNLMTPQTTAALISRFSALTQLDPSREAINLNLSWNDVNASGLFRLASQEGAPIPFTGVMLCFCLRVSDGRLVQFAYEHTYGYVYTRAARKSESGTTWTLWNKLAVTGPTNDATAGAMPWHANLRYTTNAICIGTNGIAYQAKVDNVGVNPLDDSTFATWGVWVSNWVDSRVIWLTAYDGSASNLTKTKSTPGPTDYTFELSKLGGGTDGVIASNIRELHVRVQSSGAGATASVSAQYGMNPANKIVIHNHVAPGSDRTVVIPIDPGQQSVTFSVSSVVNITTTIQLYGVKQVVVPGTGTNVGTLGFGLNATVVVLGDLEMEDVRIDEDTGYAGNTSTTLEVAAGIESDERTYLIAQLIGETAIRPADVRSVTVLAELANDRNTAAHYTASSEVHLKRGNQEIWDLIGRITDKGSAISGGNLAMRINIPVAKSQTEFTLRLTTSNAATASRLHVIGVGQRKLVAADISTADLTVPVGVTLPFAGTEIPDGYLLCDGTLKSRAEYPRLAAVIGNMYGGDLQINATFRVPDYRGCVLRMVDAGALRDTGAADRIARGDGTTGDVVGTLQLGQSNSLAQVKTENYGQSAGVFDVPDNGLWTEHGAHGVFTGKNTQANATFFRKSGKETRMVNVSTNYIIKT